MWRYLKDTIIEILFVLARMIVTATIVYLFFAFNTLYAIGFIQDISITFLVLFAFYQILILTMGFCFFRMSVSKSCATLELFPGIEEHSDTSSESLHLNPFLQSTIEIEQNSMDICEFCKTFQPNRCYHCSTCNRCFLLMYKHSYWLDICIGFTNYKFYILFLFYAIILSGLSIGSFIHGTVFDNIKEIGNILTPMFIALIFQSLILLLLLFELSVALYSVLINETPSERKYAYKRPKSISYNVGYKNNWKMIMGEKWYMWALPMWSTEGDGLTFPYVQKEKPQINISNDAYITPMNAS